MKDADIIKKLGGPTAVAKLLKFKKNGPQRVHNWIDRGIPSAIKVKHPDLFMRPDKRAKAVA